MSQMIPFTSWSVLTADFLILLHLTMGGVTLTAILTLIGAKWRYSIRNIATALFGLYPLVFAILVILMLFRHGVFPWMNGPLKNGFPSGYFYWLAVAPWPRPLNGWHNEVFLMAREIAGLVLVGWLWRRFLRLQEVSERSQEDWDRFKATASWIPVVHVLYGTMLGWDWEMTMVPRWESSIYGMAHFISNFGMTLAVIVVMCYILDRKKHRFIKGVSNNVFNYLAQMMLGFTILWTYTFYAGYMIYWYGNIPEERNRYDWMATGDYDWFFWTVIAFRFIIPFSMLVLTYVRHSPVSIYRVAIIMIIGTWLERYMWVAASVPTDAFHRAVMPFTQPFDWVVTILAFGIAWFLLRRNLIRNGVMKADAPGAAVSAA